MSRHEHDIATPMWHEIANREKGIDPVARVSRMLLDTRIEGRVGLIACDATPQVHDNSLVVEVLRHISNTRQAQIVVLSSEDIETPGLDALARYGAIQFFRARARIFTPHFLIVEGVYCNEMIEERMHETGVSVEEVVEFNRDWGSEKFRDVGNFWRNRIDSSKRTFDEMCRSLGGDMHFT